MTAFAVAAHFALFCNAGKQVQLAGLSFGSLWKVRRLRREIDRAAELAPNDTDVLIAKGALLLSLPAVLGGDASAAERLLSRALSAEPDNRVALQYFGKKD